MKALDTNHMLETLQMAYLYTLDGCYDFIGERNESNFRLTQDQQKELAKRLVSYWTDHEKLVTSNRKQKIFKDGEEALMDLLKHLA